LNAGQLAEFQNSDSLCYAYTTETSCFIINLHQFRVKFSYEAARLKVQKDGGNILLVVDVTSLSSHFDAIRAEEKWGRLWDEWQIYYYDETRSREETFVVDTPPPTISGALHIGHVFSYTQTDLIVRYQRMRGRNIFYPMGWDDNGLPTERRVQNYFHVRCDPKAQYEPDLTLQPVTPKEQKEHPPRLISRANFIELCLQLTREDEQAFMALWQRLGLSVDWRQEYSTIDNHSRRLAQLSFIDLYRKGHVYNVEAPTMWDVDFQTAVAQAEVEDRMMQGAFHHIRFGIENSDRQFIIATTRPELLPACVGIAAHPDDKRYKELFGQRAITPLFRSSVPIFPSELVDPEKGTGILMVCTFGDSNDVFWWRDSKLPLRQIIGRNGRLIPVIFGEQGWESLNPGAANEFYQELVGKTVKSARKQIVEMLQDLAGAATGQELPPLVEEPKTIEHAVKFFEKGDRPLEFITTRQWFVRLLDKKDELLKAGDAIAWHPDFMRVRYRNWTENLQLDWCISRQRFFGVPFPVWYPLDENGFPDMSYPILAESGQLPIDPSIDTPPGYEESQRDNPHGFIAESDVFDTWFTSSLTPQISAHWQLEPQRYQNLFPMDLRPQSHEIIRTWAFYTIAKSLLHENSIPWKQVAISGWILDPDRKKMSKSKGNVITPMHLLDEFGADAVRYWASSARLGVDTAFDEKILKVGKRLVTKLFNASKFVLSQSGEAQPITRELDLAFVQSLKQLVSRVTSLYDNLEYSAALKDVESFFWNNFTDTFIELVKARARGDGADKLGSGSAISALRLGLSVLLRLFAPVLPYITDEIWSWSFAEETGARSIHKMSWASSENDFDGINDPRTPDVFDLAVMCLNIINKQRAEANVSSGRTIEHLVLGMNVITANKLKLVASDVMAAARAVSYTFEVEESLDEGEFKVLSVRFVQDQ
jgi:valyl-tRNA synthetase